MWRTTGRSARPLERVEVLAGHEEDGLDLSVILMDLEMPVMDGLTCARKIRELQKSGQLVRHVPIIAVTANARMEQIDTALEAGMVKSRLYTSSLCELRTNHPSRTMSYLNLSAYRNSCQRSRDLLRIPKRQS
jgi:CheY-like chemotaxis protein